MNGHARGALLALFFVPLASASLAGCASSSSTKEAPAEPAQASGTSFWERRQAHVTKLERQGPIVDEVPTFPTPAGAVRVTYKSGASWPWAWLGLPKNVDGPRPAVVFVHGHHFLKPEDFEHLRPLLDDGFVVFTPTLRGRNGNEGSHELLYGEVDDLAASVRWLAALENVDAERIYVVGHSMGGGAAGLLALYPEVPVRLTASVGAVYSKKTWASWKANPKQAYLVRFDPADGDESELRVLGRHADELRRPHIAYMGEQERVTQENAAKAKLRADAAGKRFEVVVVPGNHSTALAPALKRFFDVVRADADSR